MSESNYVKEGKVYILGNFDETISENVIPDMVDLINKKSLERNPKIEIYINSPGGMARELFGLLSLISIAKSRGIKIITYNIGYAYSCGSILAIHGDVRKMYKYADNVAHLGISVTTSQTFEQNERNSNHIKEHFNNIVKMYTEHTKMTKKQVEEMLKDDHMHLNADKCLKLGLCDEII